jgi:hypothetical protein
MKADLLLLQGFQASSPKVILPDSSHRLDHALAILPACWLVFYLCSLIIWRFLVPKSLLSSVRKVVFEDVIQQEHLDGKSAIEVDFKLWKSLAMVLVAALRLVLEVLLLVMLLNERKRESWGVVMHATAVGSWVSSLIGV